MAITASQTSVYVYGVTWADGTVDRRGAGVAGGDVGAIEQGELAAIISAVPDGLVRAKRRDLLCHMDVLAHVFAARTVLPLRFGSVFPGLDAVAEELLSARYELLVELLHQFDGLAELRLRAAYKEEEILAEVVHDNPQIWRLRDLTRASGREADPLRVQLGEAVARGVAARRQRDVEALNAALLPLARDIAVEDLRADLELIRASYLVEQRKVDAFDARMTDLARREGGRVSFTYTGPLPPHSFVSLAGA